MFLKAAKSCSQHDKVHAINLKLRMRVLYSVWTRIYISVKVDCTDMQVLFIKKLNHINHMKVSTSE